MATTAREADHQPDRVARDRSGAARWTGRPVGPQERRRDEQEGDDGPGQVGEEVAALGELHQGDHGHRGHDGRHQDRRPGLVPRTVQAPASARRPVGRRGPARARSWRSGSGAVRAAAPSAAARRCAPAAAPAAPHRAYQATDGQHAERHEGEGGQRRQGHRGVGGERAEVDGAASGVVEDRRGPDGPGSGSGGPGPGRARPRLREGHGTNQRRPTATPADERRAVPRGPVAPTRHGQQRQEQRTPDGGLAEPGHQAQRGHGAAPCHEWGRARHARMISSGATSQVEGVRGDDRAAEPGERRRGHEEPGGQPDPAARRGPGRPPRSVRRRWRRPRRPPGPGTGSSRDRWRGPAGRRPRRGSSPGGWGRPWVTSKRATAAAYWAESQSVGPGGRRGQPGGQGRPTEQPREQQVEQVEAYGGIPVRGDAARSADPSGPGR